MSKKTCLGIIFIFFVFSQNASALYLQGYRFTDSYRYSLLDDSLKEKFPGKFVGTTSLGHVHSPFYFSDSNLNELRREIIKYNNVLTAGFSYYLSQNISLGVDLNAVSNIVFDETYTTLSDAILKSRINLIRDNSFALSINPQVFLPTGQTKNFSTMDSVSGSLSVVAEKSLNRIHFLGSVGALSSKNNEYLDVDHRQLLLTQLGVSYDFSEKINLNFESFRNIPMVNDKLQDEGKYFVTAKLKTHKYVSSYMGAGVTGWDEVERNTYSAFLGIKIHESPVAAVTSSVTTVSAAPRREIKTKEDEKALGAPLHIEEIYFDHAKHDLEQNEQLKLNTVLNYYYEAQSEIQNIVIEGYASRVGSPSFNLKLSNKRANEVRNFFIGKGIPEEMLSVVGYGDKTLQVPEEKKNRKVQFRVHK